MTAATKISKGMAVRIESADSDEYGTRFIALSAARFDRKGVKMLKLQPVGCPGRVWERPADDCCAEIDCNGSDILAMDTAVALRLQREAAQEAEHERREAIATDAERAFRWYADEHWNCATAAVNEASLRGDADGTARVEIVVHGLPWQDRETDRRGNVRDRNGVHLHRIDASADNVYRYGWRHDMPVELVGTVNWAGIGTVRTAEGRAYARAILRACAEADRMANDPAMTAARAEAVMANARAFYAAEAQAYALDGAYAQDTAARLVLIDHATDGALLDVILHALTIVPGEG